MQTYFSDRQYEQIVAAVAAVSPLLDRDQIVTWLGEKRNIWPESTRPDDETASVLPFRPAIISGTTAEKTTDD